MVEPSDGIFFQKKPTKDLKRMLRYYDYESPIDLDLHLENTKNGLKSIDYAIAVMSKGLDKDSLLKQVFRSIKFALKYRTSKVSVTEQSNFFMTVFKEKTIMRILRLFDNDIVKSQLKKGLKKIENDVKIYIPMVPEDIITLDNLDNTTEPKMIDYYLDVQ